MVDKFQFSKNLEKLWPQTKKQLEKMAADAKKLAQHSEKQLVQFSEKSKLQFELTVLQFKREQLFYRIGKAASKVIKKIKQNKGLSQLSKELDSLSRQIAACKRALSKKQ